MQSILHDLLFLYNNILLIVNRKKGIIESIYNGCDETIENISFQDFTRTIIEEKNLDLSQEKKIVNFLNNLTLSNDPFFLTASFINKEQETITFDFRGNNIDDERIMIVISDIEKKIPDPRDSLTRIYNQELTISKVKAEMLKSAPFALMLIDLDNLEIFNETYGKMYGDIVLVETAASIKKFINNKGFVGRIGGNTFLAVMYIEDNFNVIHAACKEIRKAITNVSDHNIKQALITATIGCAIYPSDANDFDSLFVKAHKALRKGKEKGKNCFVIYSEDKCGKIKIDEFKMAAKVNYTINAENTIIAGVLEILNRDQNTQENIYDSLSLIGNFFLLDRVYLFIINPDTQKFEAKYEWINPKFSNDSAAIQKDDVSFELWRNSLDETGKMKICQIESDKDRKIYKILKEQKTSAILAYELKYMNLIHGAIRYDMCKNNRFWSNRDESALMLISKIFSTFINKEHSETVYNHSLYFDRLTNIYNFTKWRDEVFNYLGNADSYVTYSLLSLQIDKYKQLVDMFGNRGCDNILIRIAESINKVFNGRGIYCRVNDDNFLIFLTTQDKDEINGFFNQIYNSFEAQPDKYRFSIIAGAYIHNKVDTLSTAIDKTYLAKKMADTQNPLYYFVPELYEEKKRISELELHMYEAKENNEFLLYLQPKINILKGEVVGAEALTRWFFKKETILTPNRFIPIFEENGFITEMDYVVFENVCKFLRGILDAGFEPLTISVNVSRYQKNFDEYIDKINSLREKYSLSPDLIEIEITEGMYIENIQLISNFMKKLHANGYKISMDDFGSGYSNLSSLANLDFDLIKLDKNFCCNIDNQKENIILTFVMNLAKELNLDVLCEGVETEEFAQYLKSIGCKIVQGFLYDRPIPAEEFKQKYFVERAKLKRLASGIRKMNK